MQKVVGSNPISRLPRLTRPTGLGLRGVSSCGASFCPVRGLVPIGLIALLATGCGGGSGSTTTASHGQASFGPRAKADYIEVADAICRNHQSRREDLESQARELGPITSQANADRIAALLRKESRNRRAEVREIEALRGPAGGAAPVLAPIRAEASLIEEWAKAYDRLDASAIRRLQIQLGLVTAKAAQTG